MEKKKKIDLKDQLTEIVHKEGQWSSQQREKIIGLIH